MFSNFVDSKTQILDPSNVPSSQLGTNLGYWLTLRNTHIWRPSPILDKYTPNRTTNVFIDFVGSENMAIDPKFTLLGESVANL